MDRNGILVTTGTQVRLHSIPNSVLETLEGNERERVDSMRGETFEVYEVDPWGHAWVEKWWSESQDQALN